MCFGEFDGATFVQHSKFRLYGIQIDENDQYYAQILNCMPVHTS